MRGVFANCSKNRKKKGEDCVKGGKGEPRKVGVSDFGKARGIASRKSKSRKVEAEWVRCRS